MTAKETWNKLIEWYGKYEINRVFNGYKGFLCCFNQHITDPEHCEPFNLNDFCKWMDAPEPDWQRDC